MKGFSIMTRTLHSKILPSAVAALALSSALLFGAAPAQAHDSVISTSPGADEVVTVNPEKVSITLSAKPADTGQLAVSKIKVTAPDSHVVSTGDVIVADNVISIAADIDHPGLHTVEWRTVSADGHPIDGKYTFTFANTAAEDTATPDTATASAEAAGQEATTPAPVAVAVPADTGSNTGLIVGAVGAGAVILAVGAYLFGRRKTGKKTTEQHNGQGSYKAPPTPR